MGGGSCCWMVEGEVVSLGCLLGVVEACPSVGSS